MCAQEMRSQEEQRATEAAEIAAAAVVVATAEEKRANKAAEAAAANENDAARNEEVEAPVDATLKEFTVAAAMAEQRESAVKVPRASTASTTIRNTTTAAQALKCRFSPRLLHQFR